MFFRKYLGLYSLSLFFSSCGTLFWGTQKKVEFSTYPSGASIYVNNQPTNCITPCSLYLNRKQENSGQNDYFISYKKEGYQDGFLALKRDLNWAPFALNCCLGGPFFIISIPVDAISGAMYDYPNPTLVTLEKKPEIKETKIYIKEPEAKPIETAIKYVFEKKSDVDVVSPTEIIKKDNSIALIVGNEDYHSFQEGLTTENDVKFALNDASAFKEYALNYLGVPEERIIFSLNATSGRMKQNITKLNLLIKNLNGEAEVFVYYAGHGFPDEATKEPYLIPVDISGINPKEGGVSLKDLYSKLNEFPSKKITVFLDACFSGGARNLGLLATRGVRIKANETSISGNLLVMAASAGEQSALPYSAKFHGMFTYFLLKKIKETNGNVSYKDLFNYINNKVSLESVSYNDKEQNPQINISPELQNKWENLPLILK